jgi:hypothetical protein
VSLRCTRVSLECTRVSLECTRVSVECTIVSLGCTRVPLGCTRVSLECTRVSLGGTRVSLGCTRVSLACTRVSLGGTRVSLELKVTGRALPALWSCFYKPHPKGWGLVYKRHRLSVCLSLCCCPPSTFSISLLLPPPPLPIPTSTSTSTSSTSCPNRIMQGQGTNVPSTNWSLSEAEAAYFITIFLNIFCYTKQIYINRRRHTSCESMCASSLAKVSQNM